MSNDFQSNIKKYADLAIHVGVNLQKGQRLMIRGPLMYGAPISAAPLVNALVESAYQAGARYVDVFWGDEQVELTRFKYADPDSLTEVPEWKAQGPYDHIMKGDAVMSITGINPDLLKDQNPALVTAYSRAIQTRIAPFMKLTSTNKVQWLVLAAPTPGWNAKVFPGMDSESASKKMWETLFKFCRLDQPDPIAAWREHTRKLESRAAYLQAKQYAWFHYRGPGTDFKIGFPEGALWTAASEKSSVGIPFIANLPTEEVFTAPHRLRAEGTIHSAMPLNYSGTLIDDFALEFKDGRVVKVNAAKGEDVLKELIATDEGAGRLGEVALVPHSSPISQSGTLFYNTLLDENASCHLALGRAYQTTVKGGGNWSDAEFNGQGGNTSLLHVDFMVGSAALDLDGIKADGTVEPVMRSGEWAFDL